MEKKKEKISTITRSEDLIRSSVNDNSHITVCEHSKNGLIITSTLAVEVSMESSHLT